MEDIGFEEDTDSEEDMDIEEALEQLADKEAYVVADIEVYEVPGIVQLPHKGFVIGYLSRWRLIRFTLTVGYDICFTLLFLCEIPREIFYST